MNSQKSVLQIHNLWGGYGAAHVIKGASMKTRSGVTGLIGSNGAGKTTMLKAIVGLVKGFEGDITFLDRSIQGEATNRIASRGLIMVPEGGGLFPTMSVEDNLLMGAYLPRARSRISESMEEAWELFPRLLERRRVDARRLSGGEQQMLAIARGMMALPRLLILDEPSLGLSPSVINTLEKAIRSIAENGVQILLCEQNASLALRISDYIYVMEYGEITVEDESSAMRENLDVTKAYFGG